MPVIRKLVRSIHIVAKTNQSDVIQRIGCVRAVLTGQAVDYTRPGTRSAIAKTAVLSPVRVEASRLQGDEQGDLRVHCGPDKAVHCYPWARSHTGAPHCQAARCSIGPVLLVRTSASICSQSTMFARRPLAGGHSRVCDQPGTSALLET